MSEQSKSTDKSVQEKLSELSELVAWFQSPAFKLEDAFDKFKQAEALAEDIEKDLTKLKNDIKVVKKRFDTEE
jgi:exodeoxyribonuclease VII small subunit